MARIGIYSGTFDPIHEGHIAFALNAATEALLDSVVFAPETYPRGKELASPVAKRISQLEEAIAPYNQLHNKILKSSPFHAYETLHELHEYFPSDELALLLGSDVCLTLDLWENVTHIFTSFELLIGLRAGHSEQEIISYFTWLAEKYTSPIRHNIVHTDFSDSASSKLRAK